MTNKTRITSFFVISLLLNSNVGFSRIDFSRIKDLQKKLPIQSAEPPFQVFVISTEMVIGRARPILEKAPKGLFVTVGSERGFRGASLAPLTTHLLLLDISPTIVRFNHINTELLKAPKLNQYKLLRWSSDLNGWLNFKTTMKNKYSTSVDLSQRDYEWWVSNVRNYQNFPYPIPELLNRFGRDILFDRFDAIHKKLDVLIAEAEKASTPLSRDEFFYKLSFEDWTHLAEKLHTQSNLDESDWTWWKTYVGDPEHPKYAYSWSKNYETAIDVGRVVDFKAGNYLYDEKLYARLHDLAVGGRIASVVLDLSNEDQTGELVASIRQSGLSVAALDLDNAYYETYLGQGTYQKLVNRFLDIGKADSVLLTMCNYKSFGASQFQIYTGFSFANVREWPKDFLLQTFYDTLPKELLDLISGRYYDVSDMPPLKYIKTNLPKTTKSEK